MQELNKRIAALDKSGSTSSPAKGASQDLEDDKVVSPQRMTQSSARNLSKSNLEEDKDVEEELAVQRIWVTAVG